MTTVGLLHPGAMGAFLGGALRAGGHRVLWAAAGRSAETRGRATDFTEVDDLAALVRGSEAILSVCPPAYALTVAADVAALGFTGLYVDANAVAPGTVARVAEVLPAGTVVDGAVIGGPSTDDAVLHLCGERAAEAADLFAPDVLTVRVLGGPLGSASALKACYALTSKAVSALLLTARSAAVASGVEAELLAEWDRTQPELTGRTLTSAERIGTKAWRFGPGMAEAAVYFRDSGVPEGFSVAAAEVFERLADLRGRPGTDPSEVWCRIAPGHSS